MGGVVEIVGVEWNFEVEFLRQDREFCSVGLVAFLGLAGLRTTLRL